MNYRRDFQNEDEAIAKNYWINTPVDMTDDKQRRNYMYRERGAEMTNRQYDLLMKEKLYPDKVESELFDQFVKCGGDPNMPLNEIWQTDLMDKFLKKYGIKKDDSFNPETGTMTVLYFGDRHDGKYYNTHFYFDSHDCFSDICYIFFKYYTMEDKLQTFDWKGFKDNVNSIVFDGLMEKSEDPYKSIEHLLRMIKYYGGNDEVIDNFLNFVKKT